MHISENVSTLCSRIAFVSLIICYSIGLLLLLTLKHVKSILASMF